MIRPLLSSRVLRVLAAIPRNASQELRVQLVEAGGRSWVERWGRARAGLGVGLLDVDRPADADRA